MLHNSLDSLKFYYFDFINNELDAYFFTIMLLKSLIAKLFYSKCGCLNR